MSWDHLLEALYQPAIVVARSLLTDLAIVQTCKLYTATVHHMLVNMLQSLDLVSLFSFLSSPSLIQISLDTTQLQFTSIRYYQRPLYDRYTRQL